jgi:hypothetical protein
MSELMRAQAAFFCTSCLFDSLHHRTISMPAIMLLDCLFMLQSLSSSMATLPQSCMLT